MAGGKVVVNAVKEIAEPVVSGLGLHLTDVEYKKEGPEWYLRIFIDKKGGVTLDDCQAVNDALTDKLDELDPIPNAYVFEVSSPGMDRPLVEDVDFELHIGEYVEVAYGYSEEKAEGILKGKTADGVIIETEDSEILISEYKTVKRTVKF